MKRNYLCVLLLALVAHQSSQVQAMWKWFTSASKGDTIAKNSVTKFEEVSKIKQLKSGISNAATTVQDFFNSKYLKMKETYATWRKSIIDNSLKKLQTKQLNLQKTVNELKQLTKNTNDPLHPTFELQLKTANIQLGTVTGEVNNLTNVQSKRANEITKIRTELQKLLEKNKDSLTPKSVDEFRKLSGEFIETQKKMQGNKKFDNIRKPTPEEMEDLSKLARDLESNSIKSKILKDDDMENVFGAIFSPSDAI